MAHPILPLFVAISCATAPVVNLNAISRDVLALSKQNPLMYLAEERDGPADGKDPHGKDPHDEIHDKEMPANKERDAYKAPQDPYADKYPQGRAPY